MTGFLLSTQGPLVRHVRRHHRSLHTIYGNLRQDCENHSSIEDVSSRFDTLHDTHPVPSDSSSSVQVHIHDGHIQVPRQCKEGKAQLLATSSKFALAPMMEYTDRHFRHFVRLISSQTLLYTEMVTANALVFQHHQQQQQKQKPGRISVSHLQKLLDQGRVPPLEGPSVLQIGGSNPNVLAQATQLISNLSTTKEIPTQSASSSPPSHVFCDYTALNLNCGCPSPKVSNSGCFGAALMEDPYRVQDCVLAMHQGCQGLYPITVKCRIGTDASLGSESSTTHTPTYDKLCQFIHIVSSSHVVTDFTIHARLALLNQKLSPADNRKIPPLQYDLVRRLVQDFPHLSFTLNGGMESLFDVQEQFHQCPKLKGIMVGRAWVANPWSFAMVDDFLYPPSNNSTGIFQTHHDSTRPENRWEILQAYGQHADEEERMWGRSKSLRRCILKAIQHLFAGEPNSKRYRIALDDIVNRLGMEEDDEEEETTNVSSSTSFSHLSSFIYQKQNPKEPLVSKLILEAAEKTLTQDVLFRSRRESYEREQEQYDKILKNTSSQLFVSQHHSPTVRNTSKLVEEWQRERKESR